MLKLVKLGRTQRRARATGGKDIGIGIGIGIYAFVAMTYSTRRVQMRVCGGDLFVFDGNGWWEI